jgi:renalase
METDIAIVGAGLAGLTAAHALREAGREIVLYDKGRRAGGRCATRKLAGATVDTGAQFFTVRSAAFADLIDQWTAEGCPIEVWGEGFAQAQCVADGPTAAKEGGDGHPRYVVAGGMSNLAAHLARDLDVRTGTRVTAVRRDGDRWSMELLGSGVSRARAVVLTPPLPQTLALLGRRPDRLADQDYEPCLALLLVLDRPPDLPSPGAVQFASGPIAWVADNAAKGASHAPALTVHVAGDGSEIFYDADAQVVTDELLGLIRPWLAGAQPIASDVFRWRYAKPRHPDDIGALLLGDSLVVAGDALAGAKVEGAVTSGLAAARQLTDGA